MLKKTFLTYGICSAAVIAANALPGAAFARNSDDDKAGSFYLQCDGRPDNGNTGRALARVVGGLASFGLIDSTGERSDSSKRIYGEEGVLACSQLIDGRDETGKGQEDNVTRRISLILARSIHQLEAANHDAALADLAKARAEADQAGLTGDVYFERSTGRGFNDIKSAILEDMGHEEAAREAKLDSLRGVNYNFQSLFLGLLRTATNEALDAEEQRQSEAFMRIHPDYASIYAAKLETQGQFAKSAEFRHAENNFDEAIDPMFIVKVDVANAAIADALAGNWERAEKTIASAKEQSNTSFNRRANNKAKVIELIDFYNIIDAFHAGKEREARARFASRSDWTAPSDGAVARLKEMLREGAPEEELFGSLAVSEPESEKAADDTVTKDASMEKVTPQDGTPQDGTPDASGATETVASMVPTTAGIAPPASTFEAPSDKDPEEKRRNQFRSLYLYTIPANSAQSFERESKNVWRVENSKYQQPTRASAGNINLIKPRGDTEVRFVAGLLHSALLAKENGFQGLIMYSALTNPTLVVRFTDPGSDIAFDQFYIPADDVIAELSPLIPDPETVRARKRARR